MGHVRDLPKKTLGVDVKKGFAAEYEVLATRKKVLDELKAAAKDADTVYLAADPDREGEAICWHLAEELKAKGKKQKVRRVVFNEITKRAIEEAFKNPAEVDEKKVDAQQARRILDRLVGYKVSPLLWDKVRRGLSAGRVQSVALRLICDREREIRAFVPEEYWSVLAHLDGRRSPPIFPANLAKKDGKNVEIVQRRAGGGGPRRPREGATYMVAEGRSPRSAGATRCRPSSPPSCSRRPSRSCASRSRRRCRWRSGCTRASSSGPTAASASSPTCAPTPRASPTTRWSRCAARIAATYGAEYLPEKPNFYRARRTRRTRTRPSAPPTSTATRSRSSSTCPRTSYALYKLIWNRFVASQMRPAVYDETLVDIAAGAVPAARQGLDPEVQGLPRRLRGDARREGDRAEARGRRTRARRGRGAADASGQVLPPLAEGDRLKLKKLDTDQHFTQPPPRFSEASLVKELEENGIGRPSTYASIIATIEAREYMEKREAKLYPTELGFLVTDLLVEHFQDIMNVEYTAAMEEELDQIEEGTDNLLNTLNQFWKKFEKDLKKAQKEMENVKAQGGADRRGLRQVRLAHGHQVGPLRQVPRLLRLSRVQEHAPDGGRRGRRRPRSTRTWPRRSAPTTASRWS